MRRLRSALGQWQRLLLLLAFGAWQALPAEEHLSAEHVKTLIPHVLRMHLLRPELDVDRMKRLLSRFLDQLDRSRTIYLKAETEALVNPGEEAFKNLAEELREGRLEYFVKWLESFKAELLPRDGEFVTKLPEHKAEVTRKIPEAEWEKVKFEEFPATLEEHRQRILLLANREYHIYREYLSEEDALKFTVQNLQRVREKWAPLEPAAQAPDLVMKALLSALDPHSEYMDSEDVEQFDTSMTRGFSGIGVQIRGCPLGAQVEKVIEGGPASKSGAFDVADQIVQVDEAPVAGLALSQIVKRIKGPKGSEVKLVLKKAKPLPDGKQMATVTLTRDNIDLTELRIKVKKFPGPEGLIGAISVTNFYNGVAGDVAERIRQLGAEQPLAGLVLDLRGNSGGLLEEAVRMAGLFITEGPVVAERDHMGLCRWLFDPDPTQVYAGPVVVLVNQFSASASEIVTGALRDYGRAVVVGASQTHGKGTVQRVIDLNLVKMPGKVKITFQQYFLARGDSVQERGILPDLEIPGPKLLEEFLERKQEGAIPWASIPGRLEDDHPDLKRYGPWKAGVLPVLKEKSAPRVAANKEFERFRKPEGEADEPEKTEADGKDQPPGLRKRDEKDPQLDEAVSIVRDALPLWAKEEAAVAK